MSEFRAEGDRVYFGHEYIGTLSAPNREIDETRLEGESWLDMRNRTKPLREHNKKVAQTMAKIAAVAFNAAAIDYAPTANKKLEASHD